MPSRLIHCPHCNRETRHGGGGLATFFTLGAAWLTICGGLAIPLFLLLFVFPPFALIGVMLLGAATLVLFPVAVGISRQEQCAECGSVLGKTPVPSAPPSDRITQIVLRQQPQDGR